MIGELADRSSRIPVHRSGSVSSNITGGFVLAFTEVHDMPKQTVWRPFGIADFDDHLRPHPMDPRQHQRRTEAAAAWRWNGKRHLVGPERLKSMPEALKFVAG